MTILSNEQDQNNQYHRKISNVDESSRGGSSAILRCLEKPISVVPAATSPSNKFSARHQPYRRPQDSPIKKSATLLPLLPVPLKFYQTLKWQWQKIDKAAILISPVCQFCSCHKTTTGAANNNNISVSEDGQSVCFFPVSRNFFQTQAHRGAQPLRKNAFTYWEITVQAPTSTAAASATSLMFGIGTKKTPLIGDGYVNLLGIDNSGWALSNRGLIWHNNQSKEFCEPLFLKDEETTIGCLFDGFRGRLAFFKNRKCLGMAFENIPMTKNGLDFNDLDTTCEKDDYYPIVSSTLAQSIFRIDFACEHFSSLQERCRRTIQQSPTEAFSAVMGPLSLLDDDQLKIASFLPRNLINFLNN